MTTLVNILEGKSACQAKNEQEEEDDGEEEELELNLIEAGCDTVIQLYKVCGALADPFFQIFAASLLKFQVRQYRPICHSTFLSNEVLLYIVPCLLEL